MTSEARRTRPLQHVTATGTALAVALGPVLVGALIARSVGADPMASVNALIAGGGQRARLSRARLGSGTELRKRAALRAASGLRKGVGPRKGAGLPGGAEARCGARPRPGSVARLARQEEALRRLLLGIRLPHRAGRLDETGRGQEFRDAVG
ncbi:hypothetical protein [Streptomyces cinereoruber]|uniref:hypothetical protein n=1 Tax=Streptomyces cinereoruber TaxID=67260 RepID=UPI003630869D